MPDGLSVELFKEIAKQAVAAAGPLPPAIREFDRYKDRIVVLPGGETKEIKADPQPRDHYVADIESLVKAATSTAKISESGDVVCWADRNSAVVVIDDNGERSNKITLPMTLSPQMKELQAIESSGKPFTQRELISTLRIKFANCSLPSELVPNLRKVNFTLNAEGTSDVTRTKVSVGKNQQAQFHGFDSLPEWLVFQLPVFHGVFRVSASINVALDPDPETQTFKLVPQLGDIERAIQSAETALVLALAQQMPDTVPVYFGTH